MAGRGESDRFVDGVRLFNRGRFFQAHEVWEELWRPSTGGMRMLYQGLIQAAAALHHAQRGNRAGALAVWSKAKVKLELCPAHFRGLSIARLRIELEDYLKAGGRATPPRLKRTPAK